MVGTMGKSVAIIAIIVVVAGVAFIATGSDIPIRSSTGGQAQTADLADTTPIQVEGGQNYNGLLTVTWDARDSNDPALPYDGADDFNIICYERITDDVRNWEVLGGGADDTDETTTIPVRKSSGLTGDQGVTEMWCEITPEVGGQPTYFDMAGTISANQRIDTCIYDDPNLDKTSDFVCRVNLLDISPSDPNNLPTMDLRLKFMEDATSADLQQASSILDIGTGNVDNKIKYIIELITTASQNDAGAKALSQFIVSINATEGDDTLYAIGGSDIRVPMGSTSQTLKFTQLNDVTLNSKIQYKWDYDQVTGQRDVASANLIVVEKGGDNEIDIPVTVETRFNALTDALCVNLELEYIDAFNVFSNTDDSVELVADNTNADECDF